MNTEQAYINGFVKRASQYGFNQDEALYILKRANTQGIKNPIKPDPMWESGKAPTTTQTAAAPKITAAKQNNAVQPSADPAPTSMPSRASMMTQTPETVAQNREIANIPLSGMTPKNQWESQLHKIMAQKPVFNVGDNENNFRGGIRPDSTIDDLAAKNAPYPIEMAGDHMNNLVRALMSDGTPAKYMHHFPDSPQNGETPRSAFLPYTIQGIKANDPRGIKIDHVNEIHNHLKKYDPTWGPDFRIPVEKHDMPEEESDLHTPWLNYAGRKAQFEKLFADRINNMNDPTANLTTNLQ